MVRNSRKVFTGNVSSDKMDKTITVIVNTYKKNFLYHKRVKKSNKFHVHDQMEVAKKGDLVSFMETKPISKTKKFRLLKVLSTVKKDKKND